jgi:serine/threonine-protein kinase
VLKEEPDWRAVSGSIPWRLEELLRRCLERDPHQRLRDIGDARIALQRIAADPADGTTGPTSGAPRHRRFRMLAAVVASAAALALAGVVGWQLARGDRAGERPVRRYTIGLPSAQGRFRLDMNDGLLSASPDGASLVYTLGGQTRPSLYRRDLDRLESARISGPDGVWWRFHSPTADGSASGAGMKVRSA